MALTINTNTGSLIVQGSLSEATKNLNKSIERMTTGYKINSAGDDAAGYSVATKMQTSLSSNQMCQANVQMGSSLLSTAESNYDLMVTHYQRIRDLVEEAANGTYGADSRAAIAAEVSARIDEIDRIKNSCDYNGIKLMDGSITAALNLQVGIGTDANSTIALATTLFANATADTLLGTNATKEKLTKFIKNESGGSTLTQALTGIDSALSNITTRQTNIGAVQNRLESAATALQVEFENLTSSLSTVKDADVAAESSAYIKSQILQQASASLLATANQTPSIALNLL